MKYRLHFKKVDEVSFDIEANEWEAERAGWWYEQKVSSGSIIPPNIFEGVWELDNLEELNG